MNNEGLIEIQRLLDTINHGDVEIRAKIYNGNVAKLEIPYVRRHKLDYSRSTAYFIEKLRDAQIQGKDTTFTLTVDVKQGGAVYIMDTGYDTKTFKINP